MEKSGATGIRSQHTGKFAFCFLKILHYLSFLPFLKKWGKQYYKIEKEAGTLKNRTICIIANHNKNDNAIALRNALSPYFDIAVIDSGSEKKYKSFILLNNIYYSGLLNYAYGMAKDLHYQYLLFVCSDVIVTPNDAREIHKITSLPGNKQWGIYAPSSIGRSHIYCRNNNTNSIRAVPFVEGFIFVASLKILDQFMPINTKINKLGWGLDLALGYYCKKLNLDCCVDDRITVYHPSGTGYSNQEAEKEMYNWLNTSPDKNLHFFCKEQIEAINAPQI